MFIAIGIFVAFALLCEVFDTKHAPSAAIYALMMAWTIWAMCR